MKRVLLFTAMIIWSTLASAIVYKWSDADGKVHYGDRPPDGVKAEVIEMLGTRVAAPAPAAPPARSAASGGSTSAAAPAAARDKPAADPSEAAAARGAQCEAAQARLKQVNEGRHLFRPGPNGEREYLTSEQIDSERLDAKKEVDAVCAGQ